MMPGPSEKHRRMRNARGRGSGWASLTGRSWMEDPATGGVLQQDAERGCSAAHGLHFTWAPQEGAAGQSIPDLLEKEGEKLPKHHIFI